jgi:hypothetical protein
VWPVRLVLGIGSAVIAVACASAPVRRPSGPWMPDAAAIGAFAEATAACRGVRTLSAEIAVAGRAGRSTLRGRILAGFERGGRLRLEGVAPFGAPLFILVARNDQGTLYLPRNHRVLAGTRVDDVLEALTGVRRDADALAALVSGCVVPNPDAGLVQRNGSAWISTTLQNGPTVFVRRDAGPWRLLRGMQEGDGVTTADWSVEYREFSSAFPTAVRLRERRPGPAGADVVTDLTLRVSQLEVNVMIDAAAFDLTVPSDASPISLDELRQNGPLAEAAREVRRVR